MALSSRELIINIKNGDPDAFKELFDSLYESLYAYAFRYVNDYFTAEEIAENAMVAIWERRLHLDPEKSLKSYLYTSVRNASIDYLKKKNKTVTLDSDYYGTELSVEQQIIKEESHRLLLQALELLPEKCREVFEMCCIEKRKYKDVAEALNISVNTVKSQRSRALKILQEELKDSQHFMLFINLLLKEG